MCLDPKDMIKNDVGGLEKILQRIRKLIEEEKPTMFLAVGYPGMKICPKSLF